MFNKISSSFKHDPDQPGKHHGQTPTAPKSSIAQSSENASDQSLHTILPTPAHRTALTLLLATITTQMRTNVTAVFDPRFAGPAAPSPNPLHDPKLDLSKVDVEKEEKLRKERERIVEELSQPELQALKKSALDFFDKWRDGVLARVGEVVNSKAEAKEQAAEVEKAGDVTPQGVPVGENTKLEKEDGSRSSAVVRADETQTKITKELYPPVQTDLAKELDQDKKRLVLHSVMLLLLSLENYAAHSRVLLLYLATSLDVPLHILAEDEGLVARTLLTAAELTADSEKQKKVEEGSNARKWKVGLATVAGAAVIGLTGGLAAPLVAGGIGVLLGSVGLEATVAAAYLGTLASSSIVVGGLFGAYGGRMTGKIMDDYAKEVEDFGFIPLKKFSRPRKIDKEYRRLRVAIGITGWLTDKEEVVKPWRVLSSSIEGFALRFEIEALLKLGNAISSMLKTTAWAYAKKALIKKTVFGVLFEALWPLGLLKVARVVDNPFSVAKARADKAGLVLADALINKVQGERPVTLIGYSMGATVIHSCLKSLADRNAFGLIESVVLLGTPAPSDAADWRRMRTVVAGRLVNVYSENDYILAFLYRTSALEYGVAGLQKVEYVKGVENIDVSDIVSGHLRYRFLSGSVLKRIGFEDLDVDLVEEEEAEMKAVEAAEEKEREEREKKDQKEHKNEDEQAHDLEKDVERKNRDSMMDWAKAKLQFGKDAVGNFWNSKDDEVKPEEGLVKDVKDLKIDEKAKNEGK